MFETRDLTIGAVLAHHATTRGDHPCVTFDGLSFTYSEVDAESNRLAHGMLAAGIEPGDHVALLLDNGPEILLSIFALGKIGAVAVPLNTAVRGSGLVYNLSHSNSTSLIVSGGLLAHVAAVAEDLTCLRRVVVVGDAEPTAGNLVDRVEPYAALRSDEAGPTGVEVSFKDLAFLMFTSGTTGPSKAVMYSHAYAFNWAAGLVDRQRHRPDDVTYVCLPLFHGNALHSATYAALLVGGTVAVAPRFSASRFWSDIVRHGATLTNLLGSMGDILWGREPSEDERANTLRQVMAAPVPKQGRRMEERFGLRMLSAFGLTDFGMSNLCTPDDPPDKLGSAGRASSDFEVRIVDDEDFEVAPGVLGEITLRPTRPWCSASGYYRMPAETVASRRELWFHTGDLGYVDEDGYLFFKDRMKDAIRRRGENISAFELEQVLIGHEAVAEVSAYAVRLDGDEEVGVSVVAAPGREVEPAELVRWCEGRMSYFMVPRFIDVRDELPRTANAKVRKEVLRQEAQERLGTYWDRVAQGIEVRRS